MPTKLEAVNLVLRRLGKTPVTQDELENGGGTTTHVEQTLDDALDHIQQEGWWWNTKYDVEATVDDSGKVNVTQLESDGSGGWLDIYHVDAMHSEAKHVTRRGDYLYDLEDNEYITATTKVMYTYARPWTEVPHAFQKYAIALAAFNFNRYFLSKQSNDGGIMLELGDARRQAMKEEIQDSNVNVLNTAEMKQLRGRPRTPDRSVY
tara:strand:- start:7027 stop:7644 length:618 start_codon:yes stop_codon:yes gene_type:complete